MTSSKLNTAIHMLSGSAESIQTKPSATRRRLLGATLFTLAGCSSLPTEKPKPVQVALHKPKIGLALGGGAARGFAHIGVIKMLESQGIVADYVVGTSAGAVVGSLLSLIHISEPTRPY